jgi:hypothetical protein
VLNARPITSLTFYLLTFNGVIDRAVNFPTAILQTCLTNPFLLAVLVEIQRNAILNVSRFFHAAT